MKQEFDNEKTNVANENIKNLKVSNKAKRFLLTTCCLVGLGIVSFTSYKAGKGQSTIVGAVTKGFEFEAQDDLMNTLVELQEKEVEEEEEEIDSRSLIDLSKINYDGDSIIRALEKAGYPSDFETRKALAEYYEIENYRGTPEQNRKLMEILSVPLDERVPGKPGVSSKDEENKDNAPSTKPSNPTKPKPNPGNNDENKTPEIETKPDSKPVNPPSGGGNTGSSTEKDPKPPAHEHSYTNKGSSYASNGNGTHTKTTTMICSCGHTNTNTANEGCNYNTLADANEAGEKYKCSGCGDLSPNLKLHDWGAESTEVRADGVYNVKTCKTCVYTSSIKIGDHSHELATDEEIYPDDDNICKIIKQHCKSCTTSIPDVIINHYWKMYDDGDGNGYDPDHVYCDYCGRDAYKNKDEYDSSPASLSDDAMLMSLLQNSNDYNFSFMNDANCVLEEDKVKSKILGC